MQERHAGRLPLLLLPGTLCDARLWAHQTRYLVDIAIPSVGDLTRDASIAAMAARVLDAAPPRFALAGLSMGAIVALEIMRRAPERVMALALLNTNPAAPRADQVAAWHDDLRMAQRGRFARIVEERWIPALLRASGSKGIFVRDVIREMAHNIGPEGYARQLAAQIGRADSWPPLKAISCPTLVLGGRQDTICPPALHDAVAAAIPHARLTIVEDCGHLSALEQPEVVTTLLHRWLEDMHGPEHQPASVAAPGVCHA